jgi:hypothetical protein
MGRAREGGEAVEQRILVVGDVALQTALKLHFRDPRRVQVTLAPNWRLALALARLERPDLVVCSETGVGRSPGACWREFEAKALGDAKLLCVADGAEACTEGGDPRLSVCPPDLFLETAAALIDPGDGPRALGRRVNLLASVRHLDAAGAEIGSSFANVLELGADRLLLEAGRVARPGDALELAFFLPGSDAGGESFPRVVLRCVIRSVRDATEMHYEAALRDADPRSRALVAAFAAGGVRAAAV